MDVIGVKVVSGLIFFLLVILFGWLPFWILRRCSSSPKNNASSVKKLPFAQFLHSMASGVLIATCLLNLLPEAIESVHGALGSSHTLKGRELKLRSDGVNDSNQTNSTHEITKYIVEITTQSSDINNSHSTNFHFKNSTDANHIESARRNNLTKIFNDTDYPTTWSIDTNVHADADTSNSPKEDHDKGNYPLAELLIAFGFLGVYMLDSLIKSVQRARKHKRESEYFSFSDVIKQHRYKRIENPNDIAKSSAAYSETDYSSGEDLAYPKPSKRRWSSMEESGDIGVLLDNQSDNDDNQSADTDTSQETGRINASSNSVEQHPLAESRRRQSANAVGDTNVRSIALASALCVHGFFDGILLGLQTSTQVLVTLLLALSVHKCFVSLSMSLTLFNHHGKDFKTSRVFLYIFLFAIATPFGIFLSAGVVHGAFSAFSQEQEGSSTSLMSGCLQAFAVGTFMYVAFTETVDKHHSKDSGVVHQLISHVFLIIGFGAMAILRAALGEV